MHIVKTVLTDFWDLYNDTSDAKLKANPDTVTYYPNAEHMPCDIGWHIAGGNLWCLRLQWDWNTVRLLPKMIIHTRKWGKDLSDGSSCIICKKNRSEMHFIPFLVDHYQTVYVVDYRYWTGSIIKLAQDKNVNDVLFLNNLSMIRNKSLVGESYTECYNTLQ